MAVATVWLWRRSPWRVVAAGALLVYWAIECLSVATDPWFGVQADPSSPLVGLAIIPVLVGFALVTLAVLALHLRQLAPSGPGVPGEG